MGLCFSIFKVRRNKSTKVQRFVDGVTDDDTDVSDTRLSLADLEYTQEVVASEQSDGDVTVRSLRRRLQRELRAGAVDPLARVPPSSRRRFHTTTGFVRRPSDFLLQRQPSTRTCRSFPVSAYRSRAFSMQQSRVSTTAPRRTVSPSKLTSFKLRMRGKLKRCTPSPAKDSNSPYAQTLSKCWTGAPPSSCLSWFWF